MLNGHAIGMGLTKVLKKLPNKKKGTLRLRIKLAPSKLV